MREYPSIRYMKDTYKGNYIYAFDKLDGSNIRIAYSKKNGFYRFGSRTKLIDESHIPLGEAITIFNRKYKKDLQEIINSNKRLGKANELMFFFEFYGDQSFAGFHVDGDPKDLVLIDVWEHTMLKPKDFIEIFGELDIPRIIYEGVLDHNFIKKVKENKFKLMEGVVIKGASMVCKLKTNDWLNRVKVKYGDKRLQEEMK